MVLEKIFGTRAKDVTPPPSLDTEGKKPATEAMEQLPAAAKSEVDRQFGTIDTQLNKDTFWTRMKNFGTYLRAGSTAALGGAAAWLAFMGGFPLVAGGAAAWASLGLWRELARKRDTDRRLREATALSFYRKESVLRRHLKKTF